MACSVPTEVPAAERARWLAEVGAALNEAHGLLTRLPLHAEHYFLAGELHMRIEAARLEVQSLQLSRSLNPRPKSDPNWSGLAPWAPVAGDR